MKEDVVAAMHEWVARHGEPPTTRCWSPYHARVDGQRDRAARFEAGEWPLALTAARLFGTFNAAVEAAGETPRTARDRRGWTREAILDALAEWSRQHARAPNQSEWPRASGDLPSVWVIRNRFGGFGAAVREAGVAPAPRARWTREAILKAIREWTDWYGQPPAKKDWDPHRARADGQTCRAERFLRGDWPSERTVRLVFGSWSDALEEAAQAS